MAEETFDRFSVSKWLRNRANSLEAAADRAYKDGRILIARSLIRESSALSTAAFDFVYEHGAAIASASKEV